MSRSKVLRAASVVAAPLLVLAMSTQASATDSWVHLDDRASMQHIDDGDHFRVWDYHADGHGVRGYLEVAYSSWGPVHSSYNGGGAGTYSEFTHDIVKIYSYRMKVCLVDGIEDTSPGPCSAWKIVHE